MGGGRVGSFVVRVVVGHCFPYRHALIKRKIDVVRKNSQQKELLTKRTVIQLNFHFVPMEERTKVYY